MTQDDSDVVALTAGLRRRDEFFFGLTLFQILGLAPFAGSAVLLIALPARTLQARGLLALAGVAVCGAGLLVVAVRVRGHTLASWLGLLIGWRLGARRAQWAPARPEAPADEGADDAALSALLARLGGTGAPPTPVSTPAVHPAASVCRARGENAEAEAPVRHKTQVLPVIPDLIADRLVTMPNGHRFGVLACGGRNLAMLPRAERQAWDRAYHRFIVGLAHPVKVLRRVRHASIADYLDRRRERARHLGNARLRQIERHDIAFMGALARAPGGVNATTTRTYVCVPAPDAVPDTAAALRLVDVVRGASLPEVAPDHSQAVAALDARCAALIAELRKLGIPAVRLDEDALAVLLHNTTRPRTAPLQPLGPDALAGAWPSIGHIDVAPLPPVPPLLVV